MIWEPLDYEYDSYRVMSVKEAILRTKYSTQPGILVDIASGDCSVPKHLAERFPMMEVIATDCRDHRKTKSDKYTFVEVPLEEIVELPDRRINIVTMLGTYYRFPDGEIKEKFHKWLVGSTEYFICSVAHKSDVLRDEFEWHKLMQYKDYGNPIYLVKIRR